MELHATEDPALLAGFLSDAACTPGGHSPRLVRPRSVDEVSAFLAGSAEPVLAIGAQSSLTGGATPFGETLLALAGLDRLERDGDRLRAGAGVLVRDVQACAAEAGLFYPPAPTYDGASIGGNAATNAAGSATFKYGSTRDWVVGLTVVLAEGSVLRLRRGEHRARDGVLELPVGGRSLRVPVPAYRNPAVRKVSAGYHAADALDAVDLFVGSEGTLGVLCEVELALTPAPAGTLTGWLCFPDEERGFAVVAELREASRRTRETGDPRGLDVRAIEHLGGGSLALLRETDVPARSRVGIPEDAALAILFELELREAVPEADILAAYEAALEGSPAEDGPVLRLFQQLARHDLLDALELAMPGDRIRRKALYALREAVPMRVNELTAEAKRGCPAVHRQALDAVVPFAALRPHLAMQRQALAEAGLRGNHWGHISDGNVHLNIFVSSEAEIDRARALLFRFAEDAIARGGCPLAEHGTGRNPTKQKLLRVFRGAAGIAAMRAVKRVLDPRGRLAPGVLFPAETS